MPQVDRRKKLTVHLGILDQNGRLLHDTALDLQVYPQVESRQSALSRPVVAVGGEADRLVGELGIEPVGFGEIQAGSAVLVIDDFAWFELNVTGSYGPSKRAPAWSSTICLPVNIRLLAGMCRSFPVG